MASLHRPLFLSDLKWLLPPPIALNLTRLDHDQHRHRLQGRATTAGGGEGVKPESSLGRLTLAAAIFVLFLGSSAVPAEEPKGGDGMTVERLFRIIEEIPTIGDTSNVEKAMHVFGFALGPLPCDGDCDLTPVWRQAWLRNFILPIRSGKKITYIYIDLDNK